MGKFVSAKPQNCWHSTATYNCILVAFNGPCEIAYDRFFHKEFHLLQMSQNRLASPEQLPDSTCVPLWIPHSCTINQINLDIPVHYHSVSCHWILPGMSGTVYVPSMPFFLPGRSWVGQAVAVSTAKAYAKVIGLHRRQNRRPLALCILSR